jgi:hypothetical protein
VTSLFNQDSINQDYPLENSSVEDFKNPHLGCLPALETRYQQINTQTSLVNNSIDDRATQGNAKGNMQEYS